MSAHPTNTKTSSKTQRKRTGGVQRKILLLLLGGVALGLSGSPRRYFYILKEIQKEWKDINNPSGRRSIKSLWAGGLLKEEQMRDGHIRLTLSPRGRETAGVFALEDIVIPLQKKIAWDRKWRLVTFDVPEKHKMTRESLRYHLKRLGFIELEKSVFLYPFDSWKQIQDIVRFYNADRFVHFIVADTISNDRKFRDHFGLSRENR